MHRDAFIKMSTRTSISRLVGEARPSLTIKIKKATARRSLSWLNGGSLKLPPEIGDECMSWRSAGDFSAHSAGHFVGTPIHHCARSCFPAL